MKGSAHRNLRLVRVLNERLAELHGNYSELARRIGESDTGTGIDRRKLKNLLEGGDVPLTIRELRALDRYLTRFGESLAANPIFDSANILQIVGNERHARILLGSRPRPLLNRVDISRWDVRSIGQILSDMNRMNMSIHFDIEDFIRTSRSRQLRQRQALSELIAGPDRSSMIAIGSSRACQATEVVLAAMFGVRPNATPRHTERRLPFYFIWPDDEQVQQHSDLPDDKKNLRSRFQLEPEEISDADPQLARDIAESVASRQAMALLLPMHPERKIWPVRRGTGIDEWTTYGVIAVQRRRSGKILLALAGLSGPATYASATNLAAVTDSGSFLADRGTDGSVVWAVVEATVRRTDEPGDGREVTSAKVCSGPEVWSAGGGL